MKIGILGRGDVDRALGTGFVQFGHEVKQGSRDAGNEKARAWAGSNGARAAAGTFAAAARFGGLAVVGRARRAQRVVGSRLQALAEVK